VEINGLKMVQKYQSPVRVYKYPFELVMAVSMQLIGYVPTYCCYALSMNALLADFTAVISEGTSYRRLVASLIIVLMLRECELFKDLRRFLFSV
jgi:hypothetical protein